MRFVEGESYVIQPVQSPRQAVQQLRIVKSPKEIEAMRSQRQLLATGLASKRRRKKITGTCRTNGGAKGTEPGLACILVRSVRMHSLLRRVRNALRCWYGNPGQHYSVHGQRARHYLSRYQVASCYPFRLDQALVGDKPSPEELRVLH